MAAHNHSSTDSSRDTPQEMSKTKTQQLEGSTAAMTSNVTGLNFANFNQDFTCISVGYQNGYRIYNCDRSKKLKIFVLFALIFSL